MLHLQSTPRLQRCLVTLYCIGEEDERRIYIRSERKGTVRGGEAIILSNSNTLNLQVTQRAGSAGPTVLWFQVYSDVLFATSLLSALPSSRPRNQLASFGRLRNVAAIVEARERHFCGAFLPLALKSDVASCATVSMIAILSKKYEPTGEVNPCSRLIYPADSYGDLSDDGRVPVLMKICSLALVLNTRRI